MIRVPSAAEYECLPYEEKRRMLTALEELRLSWLETEGVRRGA